MNRHYWYYRFKADTTWLLNHIDDIEQSSRDFVTSLTSTLGVASGFNVTQRGAGQNFSVDISSGVGYDQAGQRFFSSGTINVPFVSDELGDPITVVGAGNSRIVAIYADYALVDDPGSTAVDGFGDTVFTTATEEVAYLLYQGTDAVSPTPPAAPVGNMILLAYVTIHFGDLTIANADIDESVKQYLSIVIGPSVVGENEIDWGFGPNQVSAIDVPIADAGTLFTATEVENALQEGQVGTALTSWKISRLAANDFSITHSALSADRTGTFPDASGNIPLLPTSATTETGTGAIVRQNNPTINGLSLSDFTLSQHTHLNAAGGGTLSGNAITTTITGTGNVVKSISPTISSASILSPVINNPQITGTPQIIDFTDMNHTHESVAQGGTLSGNAITSAITGAGSVVKANSPTLSGPTLTLPIISSTGFGNANHSHSNVSSGGTLAASAIVSGVFAVGLISQGAVTQHQAALTILETQITNGLLLARVADNETITGSWQVTATADPPTADGHLRRQSLVKGWAKIASNGAILSSYNILSVTKGVTGNWNVNIDNEATTTQEFLVVVSPAWVVNTIGLMATHSVVDTNTIDVRIHDHTGTPVDAAFTIEILGNIA